MFLLNYELTAILRQYSILIVKSILKQIIVFLIISCMGVPDSGFSFELYISPKDQMEMMEQFHNHLQH